MKTVTMHGAGNQQSYFRQSFAIILVAACAISTLAFGQNAPQTPSRQDEKPACPVAQELQSAQLYGAWNVEFLPETTAAESTQAPSVRATLTLEKNVTHPDSLSGWLLLGTARIYVAGDIEDGDFSLEESEDGTKISAMWDGTIAQGSCGKAITGTRRAGEKLMRFVLRRPGWN